MFSSKLLLFVALFCYVSRVSSVLPEEPPTEPEDGPEKLNDTDTVPKDLYVIKTVVYEVGILTDAGNDTDGLNQTHEQVDVSFYDPAKNGSVIDLSSIPLPIQTNVSGVSVTGLLPGSNLASLLGGAAVAPVLPEKQITVTQNISTTDPDKGSIIISNLPKILGLTKRNESEKGDGEETSTDKEE